MNKNLPGVVPVLILVAGIGLLVFFYFALSFPFKGGTLYDRLFPKPKSEAASLFGLGFNVTGITHYGYGDILPYSSSSDVDADLRAVSDIGGTVVRVFAANDGITNAEASRRLGAFLDKAAGYNISVIVSFIDFYASGYRPAGTEKYYTDSWNGTYLLGQDFFSSGYKNEYLTFVQTLINDNKNHSNIYAWEVGNELKYDKNPNLFVSFMQDMTTKIKNLDASHPVATGMMSASHTGLTPSQLYPSLPNVDVITVHVFDGARPGEADVDWAVANSKKAIVEEVGFGGTWDRSSSMDAEVNFWRNKGVGAFLQWGFIAKGLSDNGNGDTNFGMDTIWHTDYDKLVAVFQKYFPPGCNPDRLSMAVSPDPGIVGSNMAFSLSGSEGSTYVGDEWSGGVNCSGGFWGDKTCSATAGGNFIWTHYWQNCAPNNCEFTSAQCSKQKDYSIIGSVASPSPSPISSPSPTPSSEDTTAPTVSITSPAGGATVARRSTVNIAADATDNVGVTKVEFSVNGSLTCSDTSQPYSCSWKVPAKPNTDYTLTAKAYDAAVNFAFVNITVKSAK